MKDKQIEKDEKAREKDLRNPHTDEAGSVKQLTQGLPPECST